jgi:A/G-specific adenine glycosylase
MMELGATVCVPRGPGCAQCPVMTLCATRGEHAVSERKKMRSRESAYALVRRGDAEVLLEQRDGSASLMPGMWELPSINAESAPKAKKAIMVRHSITDTNYYVTIYELGARQPRGLRKGAVRRWFAVRELPAVPLTGLARKVLKRLGAWPEFDAATVGAMESGPLRPIHEKFT